MNYTNKENLVKMLENQANKKMLDTDRRRRLDGRLELATLNAVANLLPETCKYQTTSNGNIRADYFALNCDLKNVHIFNNNTSYIQIDNSKEWTYLVIVKATYQATLKVKTKYVSNYRLTLSEIKELVADGLAKPCDKIGVDL